MTLFPFFGSHDRGSIVDRIVGASPSTNNNMISKISISSSRPDVRKDESRYALPHYPRGRSSISRGLFNLTGFLLSLPGDLLFSTFSLHVRIVDELSYLFFDFTLNLVSLAFQMLFGARFH